MCHVAVQSLGKDGFRALVLGQAFDVRTCTLTA